MTAIVDANDLLNLLSDGAFSLDTLSNLLTDGGAVAAERIFIHKDNRAEGATVPGVSANNAVSLWEYEGTPRPAGSAPTNAWVNPTNTTPGGLQQANAGGTRTKRIVRAAGFGNAAGTLIIGDRLGHIGGLDGTNITLQSFTGSLTRYTDGVGNQIWLEIYQAVGASAVGVTVAYTDSAGAAQNGFTTMGNTNRKEQCRALRVSIPAGSGSKGCKSVQSIQLAATTGTVGSYGLFVFHPLIYITMPANYSGGVTTWKNGPVPVVQPNACLSAIFIPGGGAGTYDFSITTVEN